jgi:hypothetical protein
MRFARFGILLTFLLFVVPVWSQQAQPTPTIQSVPVRPAGLAGLVYSVPDLLTAPVRDPQAVSIVQSAITAMGGTAILAIQDCIVQAQAAPGGRLISGPVTWRVAGAEFRIDAPGANGTSSLMTGHGKPGMISGTSKAVPTYLVQAVFVPVAVASVLAQELANPNMSLRFKDSETLGTESVAVVTTAMEMNYPDNVVTPQTWYFDTSTNLPVRVEFRAPDMKRATNFAPTAVDLTNYQSVSGVAYPFKVVSTLNGQTQAVFTVQSVVVNSGIPPSEFDGQFVSTGGAR